MESREPQHSPQHITRKSAEVLAGPAMGMTGLQLSYAAGRPAQRTKAPVRQADSHWSAAASPPPVDDDEAELPSPPSPPAILPSTAAAVGVKEQQLGQARQQEMEEEDNLDAAADAAHAAMQQGQQGQGLLQKAVNATSAVAQQAVELAGDAYAAVVGGGDDDVKDGPADEQQEVAPPTQAEPAGRFSAAAARQLQPGPAALQHPPLPTARQHAGTASAAAAAARPDAATAAILSASAGSPAATGKGYFPTVGGVVPAAMPAPGPSGELEARKVAVERLSGLAAEAVRAGPSTPPATALRGGRQAGMDEDWVSQLVELIWPFIKAAVEQMAWEMLPDILEASEPSWIHDINLSKFKLGDKEPDISDVRVWMDENSVVEDCFLEMMVEWHSKQDIELQIQVLPASMDKAWLPNFIEDRLKQMLTFVVGVEDAFLRGRVRVTLRPLLRRVPVIGALQVSLVDQPEFDFDLTLNNSTHIPMEPALKSWIKQAIQDAVFQAYITPEHYFLQIDPEAADIETPVGVLVTEVVEAKRVPKMDFLTRSSPFVELFVRASQKRTTSTKSPTKHPRWGETFELPIHVPDRQELRMILWDWDWASANDEIGRATLKVADLPVGQTKDLWLDVVSESDVELQAQKADMRKRDRAKIAAAKPLMKRSSKGCQLHIKATYYAFDDAEQKLIKQSQRTGLQQMLDSPQGRGINPHLRRLLLSGTLQVKVVRAGNLQVSSLVGRPSVMGVVSCGSEEKELTAVKASRHGCAQFDQAVQLDLGPDATQNHDAAVYVELEKPGWFGKSSIGQARVLLQEVIRQRKLHRELRLEGESMGFVQVELEWRPYF